MALLDFLQRGAFQQKGRSETGAALVELVSSSGVSANLDASGKLATALSAGENHIGEVGGNTKVATATPTVSVTPAYAAGEVIGAKLTFVGMGRIAGGTGLVQMAAIQSKSAQTAAIDLVLFHTDPSAFSKVVLGRLFPALVGLGLQFVGQGGGVQGLVDGGPDERGPALLAHQGVKPGKAFLGETDVRALHHEGWPSHRSLLIEGGSVAARRK